MYKRNYTDVNSKTWDKWAENGCEWSQPIREYAPQYIATRAIKKQEIFYWACESTSQVLLEDILKQGQ